jgi:hypothetical protein
MSDRTLSECRTPGALGIVATQADAAPPYRQPVDRWLSAETEASWPATSIAKPDVFAAKFPTPLERLAQ